MEVNNFVPMANKQMVGIAMGKVTEVSGNDKLNRVQVELYTPQMTLNNVQVITPSTCKINENESFGTVSIPKKESTVIVAFIDGDIRRPVIIGCVPTESNLPPLKVDKDNNIKLHKTASGMQIKIEESNKNSSLTISGKEDNNKKSSSIVFDDSKDLFKISGKDGKSSIEFNLKDGEINIKAKKITLNAEGELKLSATQGGCTISSEKSMSISGNSVEVNSKSTASVKAQSNLALDGGSKTDVKTNGVLTLKGASVQIG